MYTSTASCTPTGIIYYTSLSFRLLSAVHSLTTGGVCSARCWSGYSCHIPTNSHHLLTAHTTHHLPVPDPQRRKVHSTAGTSPMILWVSVRDGLRHTIAGVTEWALWHHSTDIWIWAGDNSRSCVVHENTWSMHKHSTERNLTTHAYFVTRALHAEEREPKSHLKLSRIILVPWKHS